MGRVTRPAPRGIEGAGGSDELGRDCGGGGGGALGGAEATTPDGDHGHLIGGKERPGRWSWITLGTESERAGLLWDNCVRTSIGEEEGKNIENRRIDQCLTENELRKV
ncbi:hypothetical protein EJB05_09680, partial [Eragrostis curvula]